MMRKEQQEDRRLLRKLVQLLEVERLSSEKGSRSSPGPGPRTQVSKLPSQLVDLRPIGMGTAEE